MIPSPQTTEALKPPQTRADLEAIVMRRDELRNQLESLNERRPAIAEQVMRGGSDPTVRAEPAARLKALDARIARIEADIQQSDDLIAGAIARGLAARTADEGIPFPGVPPVPALPGGFHFETGTPPWQDRLADSLTTTVPIAFGSVALVGVLLYWRISRSLRQQLARLTAAQTGRLEEIQRSLDTVAVEVERVSENQRFVTKLVGEKSAERL